MCYIIIFLFILNYILFYLLPFNLFLFIILFIYLYLYYVTSLELSTSPIYLFLSSYALVSFIYFI